MRKSYLKTRIDFVVMQLTGIVIDSQKNEKSVVVSEI
jgi:hypothetical protein